jgi:hypothetical protein
MQLNARYHEGVKPRALPGALPGLPVLLSLGLAIGLGGLAGCSGQVDGVGEPAVAPTPGPNPPVTRPPGMMTPGMPMPPGAAPAIDDGLPPCNPARTAFAPARLWQLTDRQYVNVVRDVLDITLSEEDGKIVSAGAADRYTNYSEGITIDSQVVPNYQTAAVKVADLGTAKMAALLGTATPGAAEMQAFIATKLARVWRRPLAPDEQAALLKLFTDAQPDGPARGFHLVLEAALQAPSFLYRTELGKPGTGDTVTLTPHELASALSFLFLESAPDEALWTRAQDGTLADPAVLATEVDRLLKLPAARVNLAQKAGYWLGVGGISNRSRNATLFPEWTETLKTSLTESVRLFLSDVINDGTLNDLLTSNRVYLNRSLGRLYGITGATGTALAPVMVPGGQRSAGILSQPGLIVAASKSDRGDVIHRGLLVNNAFVCGGAIPPAPPEAGDEAKKINGTERERAAARAAKPGCSPCHAKFDPLGLTFERYDALGRYSETRQAVLDTDTGITTWQMGPIEATAVLQDDGQKDGVSGPVEGLVGLAAKLAAAPARVGACAAAKLTEYTLGHNPDAESSCELRAVKQVLVKSGSFAAFFRALALSPGFRTRDASGAK